MWHNDMRIAFPGWTSILKMNEKITLTLDTAKGLLTVYRGEVLIGTIKDNEF